MGVGQGVWNRQLLGGLQPLLANFIQFVRIAGIAKRSRRVPDPEGSILLVSHQKV
jgi:hypothetical protein